MKKIYYIIDPFLPPIKFLFKIIPNWILNILYKLIMPFDYVIFIFFRYLIVQGMVSECGKNIAIFSNVYLKNIKNLSIGSNVSIHSLSYIDAAGGLEIGDDVSIAHNASILTFNHQFDNPNIPIKYQPTHFAKVIIKNNVWLGAGVRILSGITIQERVVVGAGSIVTKNLESNGVYVGSPAKLIKKIL